VNPLIRDRDMVLGTHRLDGDCEVGRPNGRKVAGRGLCHGSRHAHGDGEVGPLVLNALVRGRVTVLGTYRHRPAILLEAPCPV
jgi:hypothetical protein